MVLGLGKFFGGGSNVETPALDPAAQTAINSVISQALGLSAQNPAFVAPFDAAQVAGLQLLQDRPQAQFVGGASNTLSNIFSPQFASSGALSAGLGQLDRTLSGDFFGANPAASADLSRVEDSITAAANRAVGDQFSLAGRTGSPAQATSIARTVSRELAPFAFNAQESQLNRQSNAFENERSRQETAASNALNQFNTGVSQQLNALRLAPQTNDLLNEQALRLLQVGGLIQNQNQAALREPLEAFQFFINPLLSAAGGLPIQNTVTNRASGFDQLNKIGDLGGVLLDRLGL